MRQGFYIAFSGVIWLSIGVYLLFKGVDFLNKSNLKPINFSLIIMASLLVGLLKEKYILKKTVKRISKRIHSLTLPVSVFKIYDIKFYVIIFMMIILGQLLKWLSFPLIIRGGIDVAIGLALIKGGSSFLYNSIYLKKAL